MFGCDRYITLWSREKDFESNLRKKETFRRVDVPVKCRWKRQDERAISGTGANLSNNIVVVVPYYAGVHIKPGDIIALGKYDSDITGISPNTESEVKQALSPNVITVAKVAYNFDSEDTGGIYSVYGGNNGKMMGKHLRIEGK